MPTLFTRFRQLPTLLMAVAWSTLVVSYLTLSIVNNPLSFGWEMIWWTFILFPIFPALRNWYGTHALLVSAKTCDPLHEGQPGNFEAELVNPGKLPLSEITLTCGPTRATTEIDAFERITLGLDLSHLPRGQHILPPIHVSCTYPFGLLRSTRTIPLTTIATIYPKLEDNCPPWPESALHQAALSRTGDDVAALRDYVVGDPLSSVDWKLSAKRDAGGGQLVVREFEPQVKQVLAFSLEQVQDLGLEHGLSRLATWVVEATRCNQTFSLLLGNRFIPRGTHEIHAHACLLALATHPHAPFSS